MKKYGLQLRVQQSQQKKPPPTRPPLPIALGFHDDDDDDVEREISRQASKNKALKDIEEQHKKALEEDPSVFDYDGVYDEMKEKVVRPRAQDRQERKSKYIQTLMEKAKERERQHEIIFERKLAKERSTDDHLYADKDKFVTSAYKKKLAEQAKWLEEERLRQLREEKDDVTKKSDMSDFYFNLTKNVAFGAKEAEARKPEKQEEKVTAGVSDKGLRLTESPLDSSRVNKVHQGETSTPSSESFTPLDAKPVAGTPVEEKNPGEQPLADQPKRDHHKRSEDALAAAKERFLSRKKAKEH
ncbi:hypothetical protein L1049_008665 [Liquidambar formosana]|uniref:Nuclear speckle splicing regulatory protein 1 N-terminal domain-containing protein n=1 Tax=Liquidambar formosana TaxID=63359 RepID=A0AAP0SA06_LIQFO